MSTILTELPINEKSENQGEWNQKTFFLNKVIVQLLYNVQNFNHLASLVWQYLIDR